MFDNVFISYASENRNQAEKIYDGLVSTEFVPWMDKKNLKPGQKWDYHIQVALKKADYIVILLSRVSVSKVGYVQREYKAALDYCLERPDSHTYIIPVKIDNCEVPPGLDQYQFIDYNEGNCLDEILTSIRDQREKLLAEKRKIEISMLGLQFEEVKLEDEIPGRPTLKYGASYPQFTAAKGSLAELNYLIAYETVNAIASIREHYFHYSIPTANRIVEAHEENEEGIGLFFEGCALDCVTNFQFLNKNFVSYTVWKTKYTSGAAHHNYWTNAHNYILNPLMPISIEYLLDSSLDVLQVIRDLVYKRAFENAKGRFQELESPEELFLYLDFETKWENFTNFYLSPNTITFIYHPYQIAAWVYGEHHVDIKFSEIPAAILNQTKISEIVQLMQPK